MESGAATHASPTNKAWNSTCDSWLSAEAALQKYYLSIFYGLEFIVGMLGNVTVMFGYLFCLQSWNSSNVYLFNLSISDLAFLCTLPMLIPGYALGRWTLGGALCVGNRFALHANLYSSILFLSAVSMDRYLLVRFPLRQHPLQKTASAVGVSLAVWLLVILELLPILPLLQPAATNDSVDCSDYASSGDPAYNLAYSLGLTLLGFLVPLAAMCCFYYKMAVFLKRRNRPAAALPLRRPLRLLVLAVAIFSALFTPYHVMRNVRIASRLRTDAPQGCSGVAISVLYILTRPVAFLNSAVNPVFYFLMGDHFRDMLVSKLRHILKSLTSCRR